MVRLSKHFQFRNFLYSEIGNFYGKPNIPDDPDLAIAAGRKLATTLLDPLVETFGPIDIRSGYRSAALNNFGATEVKPTGSTEGGGLGKAPESVARALASDRTQRRTFF